MKKAILFTIEAMFGLMILTIFIIGIYSNMSESTLPRFSNNYLYDVSNDALIVMRHSGIIDDVIERNTKIKMDLFVNNILSSHVCSIINITDTSQSVSYVSIKPGCTLQKHNLISVLGTEIVNEQIYYVHIKSWIKS